MDDRKPAWQGELVPDSDPTEAEYLRQIELLANDVANRALDEDWLSFDPDPDDATPLQRAVNALARQLRHHHFENDGCVDPDTPLVGLAGALLVRPTTALSKHEYVDICERLGVEARPQGWALWHTWDQKGRRITMVTTRISTTEGMLLVWSRGHHMVPAKPPRAAVAATVRGWLGPAVRSPGYAAETGVMEAAVAASVPLCSTGGSTPAPSSDRDEGTHRDVSPRPETDL
ncbi:hypothetical protein [Micromonospora sp. WP24]|uniref:hypothetical protein n=1 Tax=Micromonospora sp. WP24 TaxID=2604469 RepID=UPI001651F4D8|nr:hypothetical protein [Micromonospora sp. WP24]